MYGETWPAATAAALRIDQSAPVAHTVLADRGLGAGGADGPHVGSAVAGDGDGAAVGTDGAAVLDAVERGAGCSGATLS